MLYESEKRIMTALWKAGSLKASELAKLMNEETGWNRNTTYTVIRKCIEKKLVKRTDPGYICSPLISRKQIQMQDTEEFLERAFDGNILKMFSVLSGIKPLSRFEIKEIKRLLKDTQNKAST
ncbi:MAG: BlaI/MecI/CopY family transcriptional regulator [bacterium]|nr:BlaI/MecI/CopY family transcriptional regulator [bacterium]